MTPNKLAFTDRAHFYARGRPTYPPMILDLLRSHCNLCAKSSVADVGSGTGAFCELLLQSGARVFGVEPDRQMREHAERALSSCTRFVSVEGAAEATMLPDRSIDILTAAQSFHWFDLRMFRHEAGRILRGAGWTMIVDNRRRRETDFEIALFGLQKEFAERQGENVMDPLPSQETAMRDLFGATSYEKSVFPHEQNLDWQTLIARLLSNSTVPAVGQPECTSMMTELRALFERFQAGGCVVQGYLAEVFCGRLPPSVA